jgi:hypothetical protein
MTALKKIAFSFSIRVWLTSIILSPVIFFFWTTDFTEYFSLPNFFGFYVLSILYGVVLSLPSYGCLLLLVLYLSGKKWKVGMKKGMLVLWVTILTIFPFYIVFAKDDPITLPSIIKFFVCYLITIIVGTLFYKLP